MESLETFLKAYPPKAYPRHRAIINAFLDWLEKNSRYKYPRLPKRRIPTSATPDIIRPSPTKSDIDKILRCARIRGPEVYGVFATLAYTGIRVSEACALNLCDYNAEEKPPVITVRSGKGNKDRIVPLSPLTTQAIEDQAESHESLTGLEPLLHNTLGERWTPRAVQLRLAHLCEEAQIEHLSPHDLRRFFATVLDRAGTRISVLQNLLGHSAVTTTMKYVRPDHDDITEAYKRAFK